MDADQPRDRDVSLLTDFDRSTAGRTSRARGRRRELAYLKHLEGLGWYALRVDGEGDIVAARDGITLLIQVKSTSGGPWATYGPEKRAELVSVCDRAGWIAVLVWWPPGSANPVDASPIFQWDFPGADPLPASVEYESLLAA